MINVKSFWFTDSNRQGNDELTTAITHLKKKKKKENKAYFYLKILFHFFFISHGYFLQTCLFLSNINSMFLHKHLNITDIHVYKVIIN